MLNACVYIYIWLSLGNCIKYLYFRFFIHSVDWELNKNHLVVYAFTLIELFGFVSPCHNAIHLERELLMYWNWLTRHKKLWHLFCTPVVVWSSSCGHRAHRVNTVSRAAHVWSPGPHPSDEQQPQPPPPAAAAWPGPHGLRPTRASLQPAGPGSAWAFSERTPKTKPPSPPRPPGDGRLESTRRPPKPAPTLHGPSSAVRPAGEPFPPSTSPVWDAGTTKSKWFL